MSDPLVLLADFTQDLLVQPDGVIVIGRANVSRDDFNALQIAVDQLDSGTMISFTENYDGDAEVMTYSQIQKAYFTLSFYGDDALTQATKFSTLSRSETGINLQINSGITVYNFGTIRDVKLLTGSQYSNLYELQFTMRYATSGTEDILRIDKAQYEFLVNY